MNKEKISRAIRDQATAIDQSFQAQTETLAALTRKVVETFHGGGRLLVVGNGALGAVAELTANLFLHKLSLERPLLPAISLSHNQPLAAALAREDQSREFLARQIRAVANRSDILLAYGDARRDEAIEEALSAARQAGCFTALVVQGKGEMTGDPPDLVFHLQTDSMARGIEATLFFGNLLCELVESELFGI